MKTSISTKKWLLIFLTLFATAFFVTHIVNIFFADVAYSRANKFQEFGLFELSILEFEKATKLNFYEPRYHRELAYMYASQALATENAPLKETYIKNADMEARLAYNLNPKNSLTLRSIINTYFELARIDIKYQKMAEGLIQETIDLIPTDPVLRYLEGKIFILGEKRELALDSFDEAISLKPDYREAKYTKGLSLAILERYEEAVEIFEEIGEAEKAEKYREMIHK